MVIMMCGKENGGKEEICPIILQPPMLKKKQRMDVLTLSSYPRWITDTLVQFQLQTQEFLHVTRTGAASLMPHSKSVFSL